MSYISGIRLQAIEDAQESVAWYGESASAPRFYAYVGNDPLNNVDPSGLDTAVIVGGPVAGNPFGHVAIAVTGQGVYSYGTSQPFGSNTTGYLQSQGAYRGSTVIVIPTTPAQEATIVQSMNSVSGTPYSVLSNNCATAVVNALGSAGIGLDLMANGTVGLPNLPTTAGNVASMQPGAATTFLPQGGQIPSQLSQFNPTSSAPPPSASVPAGNQGVVNQPPSLSNSDSLLSSSGSSSSGSSGK